MRNTWIIAKRELASYFSSPVAYVFIVIFLLLMGFFTFMMGGFFRYNEASLLSFFVWHPWLYMLLVPAVGMRLWAEERRMGTLELLFTMPVTLAQAITGKFLAGWLFLGFALLLTLPMPITVFYLGEPDLGPMLTGYFGSFLIAGTYLAISGMTSACTRNQVISFITSVVICLFLVLAGYPPVTSLLLKWGAANWLVEFAAGLSIIFHFESMQRGVLDLRDLIYFGTLTTFALFTTAIILRNRR
ncbi:MAG TPA: ABC transporter permease subunit [Lentisphaeria bacterium]|nr:ABC transporter permease subunit [Lentisphaerota bacterium]OQC14871.1 MAG: ABC-2 family transporter protein [Lentisphaerae bacterium ADurb.Bin082]HPY90754.1 ABC transporter permease subunit [Lentisphaeria bacterium]HQL87795.1 ABC transporter permease subunit [Lentisphaeria bacterium]